MIKIKKKFNKSKEWLENEFLTKKRTSYDIAKEVGLAQATLHYHITKFKLNRNRTSPSEETKERIRKTLQRKYKEGLLSNCLSLPPSRETIEKSIEVNSLPEYSIRTDRKGYNWIKVNGTYIKEHHYVWLTESEWGFIPNGFEIHHRNEIRNDNKIENLMCLPKGTHTKGHWFFEKENNINRFGGD